MNDAVEVIQREIAKRQNEIQALELALKALTGNATGGRKSSKHLALPGPHKPDRKRASKPQGDGNFTVNGVDLVLTEQELPLANALAEAEDCCSIDLLEELCGGKRQNLHNRIYSLNQKLKSAGAHIVHFKGEGYRLQNIEEAGAE